MRTMLWLIVLIAAHACATAPPPVRVSGSPVALAALEGEWVGENWSDETPARHGLIFFRLNAAQDSAFGDVVLIVDAGAQPGINRETPWPHIATLNQVLSITFVRAENGHITGRLDPYRDPVCGCTLATTFTGAWRDGVIEGTYRSRHLETGHMTGGRWKAERKKAGG